MSFSHLYAQALFDKQIYPFVTILSLPVCARLVGIGWACTIFLLIRLAFETFLAKLCRKVTLFTSAIACATAIKLAQTEFCKMEYE